MILLPDLRECRECTQAGTLIAEVATIHHITSSATKALSSDCTFGQSAGIGPGNPGGGAGPGAPGSHLGPAAICTGRSRFLGRPWYMHAAVPVACRMGGRVVLECWCQALRRIRPGPKSSNAMIRAWAPVRHRCAHRAGDTGPSMAAPLQALSREPRCNTRASSPKSQQPPPPIPISHSL